MEPTYKQVIAGITIPFEKAKTINELCVMIHNSLAPQGSLSQEQLDVCVELSKIVDEFK